MMEMLLDPTAGGRAELCRHVTGMTSHGCGAGAAKPAGGQSLECHLHERQSRLFRTEIRCHHQLMGSDRKR